MSDPPDNQTTPELYEIRLRGQIAQERLGWFEAMEIVHELGGETILRVEIVDQSALHGLLNKLRDLNIPLLSVEQLDEPDEQET